MATVVFPVLQQARNEALPPAAAVARLKDLCAVRAPDEDDAREAVRWGNVSALNVLLEAPAAAPHQRQAVALAAWWQLASDPLAVRQAADVVATLLTHAVPPDARDARGQTFAERVAAPLGRIEAEEAQVRNRRPSAADTGAGIRLRAVWQRLAAGGADLRSAQALRAQPLPSLDLWRRQRSTPEPVAPGRPSRPVGPR